MSGAGKTVARTLAAPDLHSSWDAAYRRAGNARLRDELVARVVRSAGVPAGARALDAGCGRGANSVRLARLGLRVTAVDFAEPALEGAREAVAAAGLEDRVELRRADLLELPFEDGAFELVLCWGVLMHIPDAAGALGELCRVVSPGRSLALGEGNRRSLDARAMRRALRAEPTPAGDEIWTDTPAGPLLVRNADADWLAGRLRDGGLEPRRPIAAELTELYTRLPAGSPAERAIHALNLRWFRSRSDWRPAAGIFLVARRPAA